jgi:hypothetical protein
MGLLASERSPARSPVTGRLRRQIPVGSRNNCSVLQVIQDGFDGFDDHLVGREGVGVLFSQMLGLVCLLTVSVSVALSDNTAVEYIYKTHVDRFWPEWLHCSHAIASAYYIRLSIEVHRRPKSKNKKLRCGFLSVLCEG